MSSTIKTTSALAAFAVVALMAGPAIAGKPMNVVEKKQAAAAMAARAQQAAPTADGSNVAQVPDDLHNYLHAQVDAKGNVRILETDGPTAPTKAVELTNE